MDCLVPGDGGAKRTKATPRDPRARDDAHLFSSHECEKSRAARMEGCEAQLKNMELKI